MFGLQDPSDNVTGQHSYHLSDFPGELLIQDLTYPDIEVEVLICHRFNVETDRGYCCHNFANLCE